MAMAEASKLFDQHGGSGGQKQDAVNGAAMTVTKLLVQSKFSGMTGGGQSGGLGGLASLVRVGFEICAPNANAIPYTYLGHQVHVILNEGSCFEVTCTLLRIAADTVIYYVYWSSFLLELHDETITSTIRTGSQAE